MNDLQNSVFEAMRMISENVNAHSEKTITIKCQIKEIIDAGIGKYKVQYLSNLFEVYASNTNVKYSIGTNVYVLVPDGDFSQEKIIIGAIKPSADNYIIGESYDNKYYDISENFFKEKNIVELSSYKKKEENDGIVYIGDGNDSFNEEELSTITILDGYFKEYNNFEFSFKVKTNLDMEQHFNGNYGATLVIPMLVKDEKDGDVLKKVNKYYTLDVGNMLGDPYGLEDWTPQSLIFSIDTTQYIYDKDSLPYISYFCYNFKEDSVKAETVKDIFLKDFCFKIVGIFEEEDSSGYKLTLTAEGGEYFLKGQNGVEKEITPILRVNGNITSLESVPHYWFVEDARVNGDNQNGDFVSYGGFGWKCLNKEKIKVDTDNNEIVPTIDYCYNTDLYKLIVNNNDITAAETRYKCVVIYDKTEVSSIITLKDLNKIGVVNLYSTNSSNTFIKEAGDVELIVDVYDDDIKNKNIEYLWQRFDKNKQLLDREVEVIKEVDKERTYFKENEEDDNSPIWLRNKFAFPTNLVEEFNIIRCFVYSDGIFIGSKEIFISVEEKIGYKLVIENGNKFYKYDVDGDSPMIEVYDGPSSSKIYNIEPLKYKVYKPDGIELTESEYNQCKYTWMVPKNSMIEVIDFDVKNENHTEDENYYYFTGKGNNSALPYKIANKYNRAKNDNDILLKVDFQGNLLDNITNIYFIKDGDSGTNGTKYAAVVTFNGAAYEEKDNNGNKQKLICIYDGTSPNANANGWYWQFNNEKYLFINNDVAFDVRVYEDGELLRNGIDDIKYEVTYSMFDSKITIPYFCFDNGKLIPTLFADIKDEEEHCNIVEAKITIKKQGNESSIFGYSNTTIYAYYPIETVVSNIPLDAAPRLTGGFSQVLYGSDGFKPEWDTTYPFECDIIKDFDIEWGWSSNNLYIKSVSEDKTQCVVMPYEKYDDGNSKNFVKLIFTKIAIEENKENEIIIYNHPVVFLLNRYGMSHINEWDGNKIYTGANDEYLLAPQIGAGKKDENNRFTGMVMGLRHLQNHNDRHQIGLFGYAEGKQSIFLNAENGSAIFGKSGGGQIIIDPSTDKALLYSSNYFKSENYDSYTGLPNYSQLNKQGMLIDLGGANIKWGNGNFEVNEKGHITAKGGGTIAGWKIENNCLKSKNNSLTFESYREELIVDENGNPILDENDNEQYDIETGVLYSHDHKKLNNTNKGFYLGNDGISIGDSLLFDENEKVLKMGKISSSSKCWTINGSSTDSYIAYGTNSFNTSANINDGSVYLGTDGISLGKDKFYVSRNGYLVSKNGKIGGWIIGTDTLTAGDTTLSSSGKITCSNLYANNSGEIGGWTISATSLAKGNVGFSSNNANNTNEAIWAGSNKEFKVDFNGKVTCTNLHVAGGSINVGGVLINNNGITLPAKAKIKSNNGFAYAMPFSVSDTGDYSLKNFVFERIDGRYNPTDPSDRITLEGKEVQAGIINAKGSLVFSGYFYNAQTININGSDYTILVRGNRRS